MSADIKTVLTDERIASILGGADGFCGHIDYRVGYRIARAIERAVLEAAPASSAMAMQAVDAERYRFIREHISDCSHDGLITINTAIEYHGAKDFDEIIDAALQASDAGRQG